MAKFAFNGKNVFYQIDGNGPNLVILNGIMMASASWEPFIPTLKKHFRVIRVDFFDQGETDKMDSDYSVDLQVDLVKGLIDHLKIKKTHLTGISYGGYVALAFAAKYGSYLDRLVVFNSVPHHNRHLVDLLNSWKEAAIRRDSNLFYQRSIPTIYSKEFINKEHLWFEKRKPLLIDNFFSNEVFLDAMIRLINSVSTFDKPVDLKMITAPTLVVASEFDQIMPSGNQYYMESLLPNATLILIPGAGHASMYEKPRLFTTLLVGFLVIEDLDYQI